MSIVIPEHLLAYEAAADENIAFAKKHPMAGDFERKLVTIAIILRKLEGDRTQAANERYRDAVKVVLLKKGYTYASIQKAFHYILHKSTAASYQEQIDEYNDAIAMLKKADAPKPSIADAPAAAKTAKTFLGSFIALAFAFSLSIVGCYIQPSSLSVRAYESKLNNMPISTADATECDKHQQHFELLQSRLKHGHSEALFFIRNYSKDAGRLGKAYDISPEIILAVAILESGAGTSGISRQARNFHGIKSGDDWQGLTFVCENNKSWRAWNTNAEGLEGFCQYICERMPHFIGKSITPAEFAYAYGSSDPKRYTEQLHSIIARYGLKTLFS